MPNTALIPSQEFPESPMRAPELMDLLLPPEEQQERVSALLEWLMSDACDVTVNSPTEVPDGELMKRVIQGGEPNSAQCFASGVI